MMNSCGRESAAQGQCRARRAGAQRDRERARATDLVDEVGRPEGAAREEAPVAGAVLVLDGEVAEEQHARRDGQRGDRDPALSTCESQYTKLQVTGTSERGGRAHLGVGLGRDEEDELQREGDEEEEICGLERSESASDLGSTRTRSRRGERASDPPNLRTQMKTWNQA